MQNTQLRYETKSCKTDYTPPIYRRHEDEFTLDAEIESEFNYENLITEDDEPLDNFFSERQQRLLPESLYTSWKRKDPFLAFSNVGIFEKNSTNPIVPDVLLSLDVKPSKNFWEKKHRCYFNAIFGKPPELVIEVVSNKIGNERTEKLKRYKNMGIKYYVIYDPGLHIYKTSLHAFQLINKSYKAFSPNDLRKKKIWFKDINIGLTVQISTYEELEAEWLRWYDSNGNILKTGKEKAEAEQMRAENAEQRVKYAEQLIINAEQRAESEKMKAKNEKKRAESEKMKAENEKKRADALEKELALLRAKML